MMGSYYNDKDYIEELFETPCELCKEPGGNKTNAPCGHNLCVSCTQKAQKSVEYKNGLTQPEKRISIENPDITFSERRNGLNVSESYLCPIKTCQQVRYKKDDELKRQSFSVDHNTRSWKHNFETCDICRFDGLHTSYATHACTQCRLYLCDKCVDVHRHKGIFEGHIILLSSDSRAKFLMGFCNKHEKLQQFRCLDCHSLLCPICQSSDGFGSASFNSRKSRKKAECPHKRIHNLARQSEDPFAIDDAQQIANLKHLQDRIDEVKQQKKTYDWHFEEVEKVIIKSIENLHDLQKRCKSDRKEVIERRKELNKIFSEELEILFAKKEELSRFTSITDLASLSPAANFYLGDKLKEVKNKKHNQKFTPSKVKIHIPTFQPIAVSGGSLSFITEEDVQEPQSPKSSISEAEMSNNTGTRECKEAISSNPPAPTHLTNQTFHGRLSNDSSQTSEEIKPIKPNSSASKESQGRLSSYSAASQTSEDIKPIKPNTLASNYTKNNAFHGRISSDSAASQTSEEIMPIKPNSLASNYLKNKGSHAKLSSDSAASQTSEDIKAIQPNRGASNHARNSSSFGRLSYDSGSSETSEEIKPIRPNLVASNNARNNASHGRLSNDSQSSQTSEEIKPILPNSLALNYRKNNASQGRLSSDSAASQISEDIKPIKPNSLASNYTKKNASHGRLSNDSQSSQTSEEIKPIQSIFNSVASNYTKSNSPHGRLSNDSWSSQASEDIKAIISNPLPSNYAKKNTSHGRISCDSAASQTSEEIKPIQPNSSVSTYTKNNSPHGRLSNDSGSSEGSDVIRPISSYSTVPRYSDNPTPHDSKSNDFESKEGRKTNSSNSTDSDYSDKSSPEGNVYMESNHQSPSDLLASTNLSKYSKSMSEIRVSKDNESSDKTDFWSAKSAPETNLKRSEAYEKIPSDVFASSLSKHFITKFKVSYDSGLEVLGQSSDAVADLPPSNNYSGKPLSRMRISNGSWPGESFDI